MPRIAEFKKLILKTMEEKSFKPLTKRALFSHLQLEPSVKESFDQAFEELKTEKQILSSNKRYHLPSKMICAGNLFVHPRGFGFVQPEEGSVVKQDIFIPKPHLMNGISEDFVQVEVTDLSSPKGPEGRIIAIIKRKKETLVGTVYSIEKAGAKVYSHTLGASKEIWLKRGKKEIAVGDRVFMQVKDWGNEKKGIRCELIEKLGSLSNPSIDVTVAAKEYDIAKDFPPEAIKESKQFGSKISALDRKGREDLTNLVTITIDPDTARDFDDALSLEKNLDKTRLGVHIADVTHYVKPGSALDQEAGMRGNSTYFPGQCLPMLPEGLSNELCSLKPNVIRLTVSVFMDFDPQGNLIDYKIVRSFIRSRKRFTYKEALAALEEKEDSPYLPLLQDLKDLCLLLKEKRRERGSVDFSIPDIVVKVDADGVPIGLEQIEYDITHQLVEECMLKANEVVAKHLHHLGVPSVYRIHEPPKEDDLSEFFYLAKAMGFSLAAEPTQKDIQELFVQAKNSVYETKLAIQYIKSMKLAIYSKDNIGHFGLALDYYAHFTSPIRRYSDLIIHRLLFNEKVEDLTKIASLCSDKERRSARAEGSVVLLKKIRLLESYHKQNPTKIYSAKIIKILPFRIVFEIEGFCLEGSLHLSDVPTDFFELQEDGSLRGNRTNQTFRLGDVIQVAVRKIDLIFLEISWSYFLEKRALKNKRGE